MNPARALGGPSPTRPRFIQLAVSCAVLGVGVGGLLTASLGSDGFSTLVNGLSIASGLAFVLMNCAVGVVFVIVAWVRGLVPGWGTIVQPLVVGATITLVLDNIGTPHGLLARAILMMAAFPVLVLGVCGYLGSGAGAGPTEAIAVALDPPVPFRWTYSALQGGGALVGWSLGAAVGPATILVIVLLGPAVDLVSSRVRLLDIHVNRTATAAPPLDDAA